ncbi:MAG TPA: hypothetical protein VFC33_09120 [Acidimicrobiia bacterium]|nr:hypothetical protein [Acidimicrobiia bacterium]
MANLLRTLARLGLRRGLLGGSRRWLIVGVVAASLRLAGRLAARTPEVVFTGELSPGDRIQIRAIPPEER